MESGRPIQKRNEQKKKPKRAKNMKNTVWTIVKIFILTMIIGGTVGSLVTYSIVKNAIEGLEPINPSYLDQIMSENSIIVDSEGNTLEAIYRDSLRTTLTYDEISPHMINALVSIEDRTFWEHDGFNFRRMFGAVRDAMMSGGRVGGTSTITQQLARNVFLPETRLVRHYDRKIQEAFYAVQLEKHLTKEQIIVAYLNFIEFGQQTQGIESAAQRYFSKSASDLDYIEAAMLAVIPKGQSVYAPMTLISQESLEPHHYVLDDSIPGMAYIYTDRGHNRYLTVLYLMKNQGYITEEEYQIGINYDVKTKLNPTPYKRSEISSYFSDMVKADVINDLMEQYGYTHNEAANLLYTGGLVIESTIDYEMQRTLESHYAREDLTPYYGNSTVSVVRRFQTDYGLSVDGSSGPATLAKLDELTSIDLSVTERQAYQRGQTHEDITLIKKALYELGYVISNENFPQVRVSMNASSHILAENSQNILLYNKGHLVKDSGELIIPANEFAFDSEGNLILKRDGRLNFYSHQNADGTQRIQIVVKDSYTIGRSLESNRFLGAGRHTIDNLYTHRGRDILVGDAFKYFDEQRNVVISRRFLDENPNFSVVDANNQLLINESYYIIDDIPVAQPQSSMVIIDYRTGELKAVTGGREGVGQQLFNRAINPRQPGSAIKPISVFTPAIDSGNYTAASVIDDRPVYLSGNPSVRWPLNWYEAYPNMLNYRGLVSVRESLEQSINVTAVIMANEMGIDFCVDYLDRFGITTVQKTGPSNDMNSSAIALGGMTHGISPMELTSAYGVFPNGGIRQEVITYRTVKTRAGNVVLDNRSSSQVVIDPNAAFIMHDMMRSTVTNGIASRSRLNRADIPVAGKTGTTSSNYDAWFVGYTPYYVGGLWFGNDINIPLNQGSMIATDFWSAVMSDIHEQKEAKNFTEPEGIVRVQIDTVSGMLPSELSLKDPRGTTKTEIFLRGTEPTETENLRVMVEICTETGKLASPGCPHSTRESRLLVQRPIPYDPSEHNGLVIRDMHYDAPVKYCDIHDGDFVDPDEPTDSDDEANDNHDNGGTLAPPVTREPFRLNENGDMLIQRPYPIFLNGGVEIIIPAGSRITKDRYVYFPDGSYLTPDAVEEVPIHTADDLDNR